MRIPSVVTVIVAVAVIVADRREVMGMEVALAEEQADPDRHGQADGDFAGCDRFTEGGHREQGAQERGGHEAGPVSRWRLRRRRRTRCPRGQP